jgi:hypothetical protein
MSPAAFRALLKRRTEVYGFPLGLVNTPFDFSSGARCKASRTSEFIGSRGNVSQPREVFEFKLVAGNHFARLHGVFVYRSHVALFARSNSVEEDF